MLRKPLLFSVIIPTRERAEKLRTCLQSLVQQSLDHDLFEVIIVDDGGQTPLDELVSDFTPALQVRLLRQENSGPAAARNSAANVAKGEILLMTDIRQPLAPQAVRALVSNLADPDIACVSGSLVLRGDAGVGVYWRYENWLRRSEGSFSRGSPAACGVAMS